MSLPPSRKSAMRFISRWKFPQPGAVVGGRALASSLVGAVSDAPQRQSITPVSAPEIQMPAERSDKQLEQTDDSLIPRSAF